MKQRFHHYFSTGGSTALFPPAIDLPILVVEDFMDASSCKKIAAELCRNEDRLLRDHDKLPVAGLTDGLTTRWLGYNVLLWDLPEIRNLRRKIERIYLSYLKKSDLDRFPNEIQCWGNILRQGESLKPHCHNYLERPALSMTLALTTAATHTVYQFPFPLRDRKNLVDQLAVKTVAGTLILVPGWVNHFTTPHSGKSKRVTLGIDIASGLTRGARVPFDDGERFLL